MKKLGRNPDDENSGAEWRETMARVRGAYEGLPAAASPEAAKLHRQAAIKAATAMGA